MKPSILNHANSIRAGALELNTNVDSHRRGILKSPDRLRQIAQRIMDEAAALLQELPQ